MGRCYGRVVGLRTFMKRCDTPAGEKFFCSSHRYQLPLALTGLLSTVVIGIIINKVSDALPPIPGTPSAVPVATEPLVVEKIVREPTIVGIKERLTGLPMKEAKELVKTYYGAELEFVVQPEPFAPYPISISTGGAAVDSAGKGASYSTRKRYSSLTRGGLYVSFKLDEKSERAASGPHPDVVWKGPLVGNVTSILLKEVNSRSSVSHVEFGGCRFTDLTSYETTKP